MLATRSDNAARRQLHRCRSRTVMMIMITLTHVLCGTQGLMYGLQPWSRGTIVPRITQQQPYALRPSVNGKVLQGKQRSQQRQKWDLQATNPGEQPPQAPAPKLNKGFRVLELAGGVVPQGALVKVARFVWGTLWRIMMAELAPQDPTGAYVRPSYDFKGVIGSPQFPAEPGRYHVYLGQACPWCHRVSLTLALRSLNNGGITFSYMCDDPERASRGGWSFTEEQPDPVFGCGDLREVYQRCSPGYEGRCTAPLIVDSKGGPDGQGAIVSNESKDIVRMLNAAHGLGGNSIDLCPPDLEQQVEETNEWVYRLINNGVYRAGFATLQAGHDKACADVETGLDRAEQILQERRFLNGDRLTESDVFLFPTAVRFDAVYAVLFRCGGRKGSLRAYPAMSRWMKEVYALPGVPATIDLVDIRRSYYQQLFPLNPGAIIPTGPSIEDLMESGSPSHSGSKPKLESVFYEQSRV